MSRWLQVVGLGEDGIDGLLPPARAALDRAGVIFGGARHHALVPTPAGRRVTWPSPFSALISEIAALRGQPVAVLVTGDPLWFSAAIEIAAAFPGEVDIHPQISAFQLAAARMGWAMADVTTLSLHGRPVTQLLRHLDPGARLILLTSGPETPAEVAACLTEAGFGPSQITLLAAMGGPGESWREGTAERWSVGRAPALHTLAIELVAAPGARPFGRAPGLPDEAFRHDGTMTKREVRAITLSRLQPMRGARLWDVGCGSGSVAVEWLRAAPGTSAIGIEPRADRRALAAENATRLGVPELEIVAGEAPAALAGLPRPDAVFLGGGLTAEAVAVALAALPPGGRLVANAVTLESEALLLACHDRHGGDLTRLALARAEALGPRSGWRPLMPVTQWALVKE